MPAELANAASSAPARCATSTRSTTSACCSSRRDRISAFDVVLPTPIPDKGRVLTGLVALLVRRDEQPGIVPNHLLGTDPARPARRFGRRGRDELRGRIDDLPPRAGRCRSRSSSAATSRAAAGRTTAAPARCAASRCPPACARASACRSRSSRPRPRRRWATTRTSTSTRWSSWSGADGGRARARRSRSTLYAFGAARAEPRGHHPRRHEVRVRHSSTARRPRLILIDEVMTPDSSRFWDAADLRAGPRPGVVRQAVRARLARDAGLGQDAARAGAAGRGRGRHARALRRGLRAHHRRLVRALPGGGRRSADEQLSLQRLGHAAATASSTRRAGRSRPSLPHLGATTSTACASGRRVELTVDAATRSEARAVGRAPGRELLRQPADRGAGTIEPHGRSRAA